MGEYRIIHKFKVIHSNFNYTLELDYCIADECYRLYLRDEDDNTIERALMAFQSENDALATMYAEITANHIIL